jgi:acetyl-CoA synthetase
MQGIHCKYVNETYNDKGILTDFSLNIPEDFNFAYDIVDEMAKLEPKKIAMVWCNPAGEEWVFTYADMKRCKLFFFDWNSQGRYGYAYSKTSL